MEVLNVDPGCRYDARNLLVQMMSGQQGASKSTLRAPRICTLRTKRLQSNPEPSRPILRTLSGGAREDAPCKGRRAVQKAATARGMQNRVSKSGRSAFHKKQLDSCWRSTQTHTRGGQLTTTRSTRQAPNAGPRAHGQTKSLEKEKLTPDPHENLHSSQA